MNRTDFMRQLESLLQNISPAEREAALQYYNDYFDDAGPENEQDVMEALGNPARVAESIKRDQTINRASGRGAYKGETENDYRHEDARGNSVRNPIVRQNDSHSDEQSGQSGQYGSGQKPKEDMPTWLLVLLIIGGIIISPFVLGLASSLVGAVIGLIAGWFALILGFGIAAFVLIMLLAVLVVAGIMSFKAPFTAVGLIGGGFICGGLGILFLMLTVAMAGIATPAIFRGIGKLVDYLRGKTKKEVIA